MGWVSPTSHSGDWYTDPTYAYDGSTDTFAMLDREVGAGILTPAAPVLCTKIRLWASMLFTSQANFKIEVYYGSAYHTIHDGLLAALQWVEIEIGSTQTVENVKLTPQTIILTDKLHELQFYEETAPPTTDSGLGGRRISNILNRF